MTVPGQVAGWLALSKRFGKLSFQQVFGPAVDYAERGFPVSPFVASVWPELAARVSDQPRFAKTFLIDGRSPVAGEVWRAPGDAHALQAIAETEGETFYRGALAEAIVSFSERAGGCLSLDDFAAHEPVWCEPLVISIRSRNRSAMRRVSCCRQRMAWSMSRPICREMSPICWRHAAIACRHCRRGI